MFDFVPVCGPVVAWVNAFLAGSEPLDESLHGIASSGAAPLVDGFASADADDTGPHQWAHVLGKLRNQGVGAVRLALATPGDLADLPGPPELNRVVLTIGQCALTIGGPGGALIPTSDELWLWAPSADSRPRGAQVSEAARGLADCMADSSADLERLDVARGRDDAENELRAIEAQVANLVLPSALPTRALTLIRRGITVWAAVSLATTSEGGALTVSEIDQRARALAPVARAARRAVEAGFSAQAFAP